ncbi:MAG: methyl-accepting chemotaxis protein [Pseudomonadota bacterium]|jgi:methyl-accepting chemotaxis protein
MNRTLPPQNRETLDKAASQRSFRYALLGLGVGLLTPLGWIALDYIFMRPDGTGAVPWFNSLFSENPRNIVVALYMAFGTSTVMATFGYLIGRMDSRIHEEQKKMSETYKLYMAKEEMFEERLFILHGRMNNITHVSASIQRSSSMEEVFQIVADGIHDILEFDRVNIFLINSETGMIDCVQARGNRDEPLERIRLPMNEEGGVVWQTIQSNKALIIRDSSELPPEHRLAAPYDRIQALRSSSFMLIPFRDGKDPIGLFAVDNKFKKSPINDEEIDLIKVLADQTSVAMSNIRLIHGIRRMDELMDQIFVTIQEKRERYSGEIQKLARSTTQLREAADSLAADGEQILASADEGTATAKELDNVGNTVNEGTDELVSSMEEIAVVARSMREALEEIRTRSEDSARADEQATLEVDSGKKVFSETREGIQSLNRNMEDFAATMDGLMNRSVAVKDTIRIIDEIMGQTRLLALNASIIAAQAGVHGKSFSVVAEEIGNLSRDVEGSTKAIDDAMDQFESDIQVVMNSTEQIREAVNSTASNTARFEEVLNRIDESFRHSREISIGIRDETVKQADAAISVVDTTANINEMASRLKQGAERQKEKTGFISSSAESMTEISYRLSQTARVNQEGSRALLLTVSESEQIFETLFVSLAEWRELGKELLKELETFGV